MDAVGELLKVDEAANAADAERSPAGRRSGSGLGSVMAHMNAAAPKAARPDPKVPAAVPAAAE